MEAEQKYRIIHRFTAYSKKKGSYQKGHIIAFDLTWEFVEIYLKRNYPGKVLDKKTNSFTIPGLLYPGSIHVQKSKPK